MADFMDFFTMDVKIIPLDKKKSQFNKPMKQKKNSILNMGGDLGDFMGKGIYDIESDYGKYIANSGGLNYLNQGIKLGGKNSSSFNDIGFSTNQFNDVGGDYMAYIDKYSGKKSKGGDDFFQYIEAGTPKAFNRYGKMSKKEKSYRSVGPEDEVIFGFESLGFATDRAEKSIGTAATVSSKRIKKLAKEESEKFKKVKGYVSSKLKERRIKSRIKPDLEETRSLTSDTDTSYESDEGHGIMRKGSKVLTRVGKNKFGKDIYKVSDDLGDLR